MGWRPTCGPHAGSTEVTEPTADGTAGGTLRHSEGIAAARTLIALEANATASLRLAIDRPVSLVTSMGCLHGRPRRGSRQVPRRPTCPHYALADLCEGDARCHTAPRDVFRRFGHWRDPSVSCLPSKRHGDVGNSRQTELAVVQGELTDVFDGRQQVVGAVIERPYMRQGCVPRPVNPHSGNCGTSSEWDSMKGAIV